MPSFYYFTYAYIIAYQDMIFHAGSKQFVVQSGKKISPLSLRLTAKILLKRLSQHLQAQSF